MRIETRLLRREADATSEERTVRFSSLVLPCPPVQRVSCSTLEMRRMTGKPVNPLPLTKSAWFSYLKYTSLMQRTSKSLEEKEEELVELLRVTLMSNLKVNSSQVACVSQVARCESGEHLQLVASGRGSNLSYYEWQRAKKIEWDEAKQKGEENVWRKITCLCKIHLSVKGWKKKLATRVTTFNRRERVRRKSEWEDEREQAK